MFTVRGRIYTNCILVTFKCVAMTLSFTPFAIAIVGTWFTMRCYGFGTLILPIYFVSKFFFSARPCSHLCAVLLLLLDYLDPEVDTMLVRRDAIDFWF